MTHSILKSFYTENIVVTAFIRKLLLISIGVLNNKITFDEKLTLKYEKIYLTFNMESLIFCPSVGIVKNYEII